MNGIGPKVHRIGYGMNEYFQDKYQSFTRKNTDKLFATESCSGYVLIINCHDKNKIVSQKMKVVHPSYSSFSNICGRSPSIISPSKEPD